MDDLSKIAMGQARIEEKVNSIHTQMEYFAENQKGQYKLLSNHALKIHGLEKDKAWNRTILGTLFALVLAWLGFDRK